MIRAHDVEPDRIAAQLSPILSHCILPPKAIAHFVMAAGFVSIELTAFSRRPLRLKLESAKAISEKLLGEGMPCFETAVVVAAQEVSRLGLGRSTYLYSNDGYNAAGYAAFAHGEPVAHEFVNWHGEEMYRFSGIAAQETEGPEVFARGAAAAGLSSVEWVDDMFGLFYEEEAVTTSLVLVEKGEVLGTPKPA